jgi:AbrB family looped-hinge helix DNA binding protein
MLSTVTIKGQVTIPKEVRDLLHIHPNDKVDFIIEGGRAVIVPVRTLKELRGAVAPKEGATIAAERKAARRAVARRVAGESE